MSLTLAALALLAACVLVQSTGMLLLIHWLARLRRVLLTIEPGKRGGKPCIRCLRITVYDVLEYLASGMTEDEILQDLPDLTARASVPASRSPRTATVGSW